MSAHVLLNLLNEWKKEIKCNNTGARMLDFINHMTLIQLLLYYFEITFLV